MTRNQIDEQSRHKVDFFPSFLTFSVLSLLRLALSNSPFEYRSYLQGKYRAVSLSHGDAAMSVRKCIECRVVSGVQLEINCRTVQQFVCSFVRSAELRVSVERYSSLYCVHYY
jgi:hypothetical protein